MFLYSLIFLIPFCLLILPSLAFGICAGKKSNKSPLKHKSSPTIVDETFPQLKVKINKKNAAADESKTSKQTTPKKIDAKIEDPKSGKVSGKDVPTVVDSKPAKSGVDDPSKDISKAKKTESTPESKPTVGKSTIDGKSTKSPKSEKKSNIIRPNGQLQKAKGKEPVDDFGKNLKNADDQNDPSKSGPILKVEAEDMPSEKASPAREEV